MPFNVVLYQPEIAPNTGNAIRLCANTGCALHLVRPLGFDWDDKRLRRAGLDYQEWAKVNHWDSFEDYCAQRDPASGLYAFTTRATAPHSGATFRAGDTLLFGPETRGLPVELLDAMADEQKLRLPMVESSRSLNLSNSIAVAVYEAWRQIDYAGARP